MAYITFTTFFTLIGILLTANIIFRILSFLHLNLVHRSTIDRYAHSNAYALITGASDGIGLGFARELLAHGFNIILHGRNEAKLKSIQADLQKQHPKRDLKFYVADASLTAKPGVDAMDAMLKQFSSLPITVLINNVGGMVGISPVFNHLESRTSADIEHCLALNSIYPTQMTRALLPIMKKHQPALILNISSLSAVTATPFMDIYNGAKAYLVHWSHSIRNEMQATKSDIEVMLIETGTVLTTGNPVVSKETLFCPTDRNFARSVLQKVGCWKWKVCGHWPHAVQKWTLLSLPEPVLEWVLLMLGNKLRSEEEEKAKKGK